MGWTWAARVLLFLLISRGLARAEGWVPLARGVEYRFFQWIDKPATGDGKLHVVRIDPRVARLFAGAASARDRQNRTTAQWCRDFDLLVAINAGMYQTDLMTHAGYYRIGTHENNKRWARSYQSVLAFNPREGGSSKMVVLIDRDAEPTFRFDPYEVVIQNLRLIKGKGQSVWTKTQRPWSEAALGMDAQGKILFLFSRSLLSMDEFNRNLLALPLGIEQAMHLEGGREASLSVHAAGTDLDLAGGYEIVLGAGEGRASQLPLPNIIGVRK